MGVVRAATLVLVLVLAGASASEARAAVIAVIEPQPVNKQLEEEFWGHVDEHERRGAAAVEPAETWEMRLLDAAEPGVTPPVALPNARRVRRYPGLYSAPGWRGAILGLRIAGAWLLVEGGASTSVRERVLAHLRARTGP
jgi:hypothetical protein